MGASIVLVKEELRYCMQPQNRVQGLLRMRTVGVRKGESLALLKFRTKSALQLLFLIFIELGDPSLDPRCAGFGKFHPR